MATKQTNQTVISEYCIRKNKIVWLLLQMKTEPSHYCNLPREAQLYTSRKMADDVALEMAHDNLGDLFEVWDMVKMRKLTTICIAPE